MNSRFFKRKREVILISLLVLLFLSSLISSRKAQTIRRGLQNSAHDLTNESTAVCFNCHWMHQRADTVSVMYGWDHALISERTLYLCFVCHGNVDPNTDSGKVWLGKGEGGMNFLPAHFFDSAIRQKYPRSATDSTLVNFPGQNGQNPYNVYKTYDAVVTYHTTTIETTYGTEIVYETIIDTLYVGSYHLRIEDMIDNYFECFDCHNHGVFNTTFTGGRLPKLLWSKAKKYYDTLGVSVSDRKDISKYYAKEYFCLSCHSRNAYPDKWNDTSRWDTLRKPPQKNDTAFFSTKHTLLERYGTRTYDVGAPESTNSYGYGNDISCLVCHSIHASAYPDLMKGNYNENTMCLQCHQMPTGGHDTGGVYDSMFAYRHETTGAVNYITAGHIADKTNYNNGHGKPLINLNCSACHEAHGTGHYKMLKSVVYLDSAHRGFETTYTLTSQEIAGLDDTASHRISDFCAGACHRVATKNRLVTWWNNETGTVVDTSMPSIFRGKDKFDSSKHLGAENTYQEIRFPNYDLKDCVSCHDSHGTQFNAITWANQEDLCFQCHNETSGTSAPNIERFFNTATYGKSHHPVRTSEQNSTKVIECTNCHNPHLATKEDPVIYPYDWSSPSGKTQKLSLYGSVQVKDHENRVSFCATCHSDVYRNANNLEDRRLETPSDAPGFFPPGVRIVPAKRVANSFYGLDLAQSTVVIAGSGHFKAFPGYIDCLSCHTPHGTRNPFNIRDTVYTDPIDSCTDTFIVNEYIFNTAFYFVNTWESRAFCYSPDGRTGCHTPQYLTTQVVFPGTSYVAGTDSTLGVDSTHHYARKVPYGPRHSTTDVGYLTTSYYIDEHDPYYDTSFETPASGIIGCSICHYLPHNPTPDVWYNLSATSTSQFCLDCHRPPAARPSNYVTAAKYYGGAPSKYELPFVDFVSTTVYPLSTTYVSRHLDSTSQGSNQGMNPTTSGYCKNCHGDHTYNTTIGYHDVPGAFVRNTYNSKNYESSSLFCLGCHRGISDSTHSFGAAVAPNIDVTYEVAGHGKLSTLSGSVDTYCFDCHTKHSSSNPYLLRTTIRDLITYNTVADVINRSIRPEQLDSTYTKTVNVRLNGLQYVCFGCHSEPGDTTRDTSDVPADNARHPHPGTNLWLGKDVYESSGHGYTYITPFAYVDTLYYGYATTSTGGMKCSWCHEPHGRGVDSTNTTALWYRAFNSTFNDDMLRIEGSVTLCYKCHNRPLTAPDSSYSIANIKALFDDSTIYSRHDIYSTDAVNIGQITCLNCHNPHTGSKAEPVVVADQRTVVNFGDDEFCISCHGPAENIPTFPTSPKPDVKFPIRGSWNKSLYGVSAHGDSAYIQSVYGAGAKTVFCRTCHKPHGTAKKDLLREVYDFKQNGQLGKYSYETIKTDFTTYATISVIDYKDEEVCFGCHKEHNGADSTDWSAAWPGIPDIRKFYYNSTGGYNRSYHNIFTSTQVGPDGKWGGASKDDTQIECASCHNQHIATKAKPVTDPDNPEIAMGAYGEEGITFCLRCHDNDPPPGILGLTDEKYKNIRTEYDPDEDGVFVNYTGHYRQRDGKQFECRVCHSMHGSSFSKQIRDDVTDTTSDTSLLVRYMWNVKLDSSNPFSGRDNLNMSSFEEMCLSCHSGRTQFYDANYPGADKWRDIPLPPPNQYLNGSVTVAKYHPTLQHTTDIYFGTADTVRKTVLSVYDSVDFNIDTSVAFDSAGCGCHGAHNPFKYSSDEFSKCFNCHDNLAKTTPDIKTAFSSTNFTGSNSPLIEDDNTLLLLHLDAVGYEGTSKELPVDKYGLKIVSGRYGMGVLFDTSASDTTRLTYPLWSSISSGAQATGGIATNDSSLTLRFDGNLLGDGSVTDYNASGVTYAEGKFGGSSGAVYVDSNDTLNYNIVSSISQYENNFNIYSQGSNVTSAERWERIANKGASYTFDLDSTGSMALKCVHPTNADAEKDYARYTLAQSISNLRMDFDLTIPSSNNSDFIIRVDGNGYMQMYTWFSNGTWIAKYVNRNSPYQELTANIATGLSGERRLTCIFNYSAGTVTYYVDGVNRATVNIYPRLAGEKEPPKYIYFGNAGAQTTTTTWYMDNLQLSNYGTRRNIYVESSTIEAWVKITGAGTGIQNTSKDRYVFLYTTSNSKSYRNSIFLKHSTLNLWEFGRSDETGYMNAISTPDNLTYGWHHFAATWNNTDRMLKLYIDGQLRAEEGATLYPKSVEQLGISPSNQNFWIGTSPLQECADAAIDDFQLTNMIKTAEQISTDFTGISEKNFNEKRGTLSLWFKPLWDGNDSINHTIFENYYDTANYFLLQKTSADQLKFTIMGKGTKTELVKAVDSTSLPRNEWSHIAVSWEELTSTYGNMDLYLNGTKADSTITAKMMTAPGQFLYFGSRRDNTEMLSGAIDEVWITDIREDNISGVAAGYSNVEKGSTTSPSISYLPDPLSLKLLLSYDTTFNGADGETADVAGVSFTAGKFDSGALFTGTAYARYQAGIIYSNLSQFYNKKFDSNTFGVGIKDSTGVTFTKGFLGDTGGVMIDSADVLSYTAGTRIVQGGEAYAALWKMNNNWNDTKGVSNGTAYGGATFIDSTFTTNLTGFLQAGNFTGAANCYVNCGDQANTRFGTGSFAISVWLRPNSLSSADDAARTRFLAKSDAVASPTGSYWAAELDTTGAVYLMGRSSDSTTFFITSTPGAVSVGSWQNITFNLHQGTKKGYVYVNGVNKTAGGYANLSTLRGNLDAAGKSFTMSCAWGEYNGYMDDLAFYKSTLSEDMIKFHAGVLNVAKNGTYQTWINYDSNTSSSGGDRYLLRIDTASTNNISLYRRSSDTSWVLRVSNTAGDSTEIKVADNLSYGWHNMAATWDSQSLNFYIDGMLKGTSLNPKLPDSTVNYYYVGCGGQNNTQINSVLDENLLDTTLTTGSNIISSITPQYYNYNASAGTIEMWMKPYNWTGSDTTKVRYLFDINSNGNSSRISMYYDTDRTIKFAVYDSTGLLGLTAWNASGLDTTAFRHYAGTWNEYNVNLYVNGALVDSTKWEDRRPAQAAPVIFIGSDSYMKNQADAVIDEVRIFNNMRSDAAISADAGNLFDYKSYYANSFDPYDGGSRHPINYDTVNFTGTNVKYMECLKCHLQIKPDSTAIYHRSKIVEFVDVASDTSWNSRKPFAYGSDNTSKRNVTMFCLSCHMMDSAAEALDSAYGSDSPYRFTGPNQVYGGRPVQLRPLDAYDSLQPNPAGGYYYPIDTASAHFDSSFGTTAFGGLSCTDCHDPHGSINKTMLQDFEEYKDGKDYNRDGNSTRVIMYSDRENVRKYQLNEEKFCYFCHGSKDNDKGRFNSTGINQGWTMKDIEGKFAHSGAHHMVDDTEQANNDAKIECSNCHNPHTARRDKVVLNPKSGQRTAVASKEQMNAFCLGCHAAMDGAILPTSWSEGVKFPGYSLNKNGPEWSGKEDSQWNKFNKESMAYGNYNFGNKHYYSTLEVSCAGCHDPHGTSNYRMLLETVVNAFNPAQTTYVYGLKLMPQIKPDGRRRYEVYSTAFNSAATNYSINRFCMGCHSAAMGYNVDYPRNYVYPGKNYYDSWDFGDKITTASVNDIRYDTIRVPQSGAVYTVPDIYGKDKDCDYCHNPHSSDSTRIHMVRDNVPQDLDRFSANYGNRVASDYWFKEGYAATGIDFCLSKSCHVTNREAKLGPRDVYYTPSGSSYWWYKPYDQFNLMDFSRPGALTFSTMRPESFEPDNNLYVSARVSKHPIVTYDEFLHQGNTLICLSCHTPHGSPGNTELAASYGNTAGYQSTYPQDNAGLRRAYYRRIYWYPMTLYKRGTRDDVVVRSSQGTGQSNFVNWSSQAYDYLNMLQNIKNLSLFNDYNPMNYQEAARRTGIPTGGNDICFMCHPKDDIIGKNQLGVGIDTTKTRFIGHEAVIDGARIGHTNFGTGSEVGGPGLNFGYSPVPSDYHMFTCSTCHGPHASTNEKLLTMKCFAFNKRLPASGKPLWTVSPGYMCHPYDNTGSSNWGGSYIGWKRFTNTTKKDLVRPSDTIDTLYVYFNTTRAYDTVVPVPNLGLPVKSNDMDVVLAWKTAYDSNETKWVDHYNIYRGDTALSKENKTHKAQPIRTWKEWGYTLFTKIYDTNSTRPADQYQTLYTIDPSMSHKLGSKYYYMVVAADAEDNEAVIPQSQDTTGVYYSTDIMPPRQVTSIRLVQETINGYNYRIRIMWQDPGDNLATKGYNLYDTLLNNGVTPDTTQFSSIWSSRLDSSSIPGFNTDVVTGVNFGDYYDTVMEDSTFNSASLAKIFYVGIKAYDSSGNTTNVFGTKYIKILDPSPEYIQNLTARPQITTNGTGQADKYNVNLSWSVPWDNSNSVAAFKVYRRLGAPINQFSIDGYNLRGGSEVECVTTLTSYNSLNIGQYPTGSTVECVDNISPYNVYYYAVTSIDRFDTNINNWDIGYDTIYNSVLNKYIIYRESMLPKYNTRLLDPVSAAMKVVKQNTKFIFSFPAAVYNTANFKQYNFYRHYQTENVWTKGSFYQTALSHGLPGDCNQGSCHISKNPTNHNWDTATGCVGCHTGNARGEDNVSTSAPIGNYTFAASILYTSTYIAIDGQTTWLDTLEAPINNTTTKNVLDLVPPAPITLYVSLVPKKENGYNSVQLTWSGGTDTTNFKGYVLSRHRENQSTGVYADVDWANLGTVTVMSQTTYVQTVPGPVMAWQSAANLFGNFEYTYKAVAWDSADNFSNAVTTLITMPPTVQNFTSRALTEAIGIKLSWSDMLTYSEIKNLGDSCYQIYGRPASSAADRMTSTFIGTTLTLAPNVKLIGTKPAKASGAVYSKLNQVVELNAYITASSSNPYSPVGYAGDNEVSTFWGAAPNDTSSSAYIEFDLGTAILVGSMVYNNYTADPTDTSQGFVIRYSDTTSNSTKVWDTLITMPITSRRTFTFGREYGLNQTKTTRYIQVTNFTNQDTTWPAGSVSELQVFYPSGDDTTEIIHNDRVPPDMPIKGGQYYAYSIILQNMNNTLSQTYYLPAALSCIDFIAPNSVRDLAAWGIAGASNKIYLQWTDPGDNVGVTRYQVWRHIGNDYIYDSFTDLGRNRCIDTLYATAYVSASVLYYTDNYCTTDDIYFYAIAALDSTNNRSKFTGRNYTANARPNKSKDTTPPEPVTLLTCTFNKLETTISLTWGQAVDRADYTSTGAIDTRFNSGVAYIKGYGVYRVDYDLDSTPFANDIANIANRNTFDSGGGWNTAGVIDTVNVAKGWRVGTWGGDQSPKIVPEIVTDPGRLTKVQKISVSGYEGDSKERVDASAYPFMKTGAYIKSTGYEFETSMNVGEDSSAIHYVFGVWLKAEGPGTGDTCSGYVYLDAGTNFGTGNNESTFVSFARREIYKPGRNWAYYRINFMTPTSGLSDSTQNGIMIWTTGNCKIWLDDAKLVKLGNAIASPYPNDLSLTDNKIILGRSYYYAITARDQSYDPSWNESDFANIMSKRADVTAPIFDTAYFYNLDTSSVDLTPWNPFDANKTGNTWTVQFVPGATPVGYRNPNYDPAFDSDNIFKNEHTIDTTNIYGDCITLQFRMLDGYGSTAEMDILETPSAGRGIDKDFKIAEDSSGVDSYREEIFNAKHLGNGIYSFTYKISLDNTRPDTPYDTVNHMYDSTKLYKLKIIVQDKSGNGPWVDALDNYRIIDALTTDNNPDSTFRCILDNTPPGWPQ